MTIDILSDLHFNNYFYQRITENEIIELYSDIFSKNNRTIGDVLVIAGDLGHDNKQNIIALKLIKKLFGYKYIICVLGNHDYYLSNNGDRKKYFTKSTFRASRMRDIINNEKDMHCLDGDIIEIEGIKFGGVDSWYDGEYIKEHFGERAPNPDYTKDNLWINKYWFDTMISDRKNLFEFDWTEQSIKEKNKIEKIYQNIDVMITHVNPSIEKQHTKEEYRNLEMSGFFSFDGKKYLLNGNMKFWIYGHTHTPCEFIINGVTCICNPMGYVKESGFGEFIDIKQIEINQ